MLFASQFDVLEEILDVVFCCRILFKNCDLKAETPSEIDHFVAVLKNVFKKRIARAHYDEQDFDISVFGLLC